MCGKGVKGMCGKGGEGGERECGVSQTPLSYCISYIATSILVQEVEFAGLNPLCLPLASRVCYMPFLELLDGCFACPCKPFI